MGAITDLLESLSVTPVTPEKKRCNQLHAASSVVVTQVTPVTPIKTNAKANTQKRPILTFAIDGTPKRITAIDTVATSPAEALHRLRLAWGEKLHQVWDADDWLIWERNQPSTLEQ